MNINIPILYHIFIDTNVYIDAKWLSKSNKEIDTLKKNLGKENFVLLTHPILMGELKKNLIGDHLGRYEATKAFISKFCETSSLKNITVAKEFEKIISPHTAQWQSFIELLNTFNEIKELSYEDCDLQQIFHLYFSTSAPFENANDKKAEFPDACLISALERYSQSILLPNIEILVISHDKGWKNYFDLNKTAKNIQFFYDLSGALSHMIQNEMTSEQYEQLSDKISKCINNYESDIEDYLQKNISSDNFDQYELVISSIDELSITDINFEEIIDIDNDSETITIAVSANISCLIIGNRYHEIYDEYDRERLPMGRMKSSGFYETDFIFYLTFPVEDLANNGKNFDFTTNVSEIIFDDCESNVLDTGEIFFPDQDDDDEFIQST